jgi:prepilin-type N-terminal cleavage/methylation domain-containing protein
MNQKGITIVELLIVIVVLGIISAFSAVAIGNIIENNRAESFANTARMMITAASLSYTQNDPLWDDNVATMQELIDSEYLDAKSTDPWGESYDMTNSYVIVETVAGIVEDEFFVSTIIFLSNTTVFKVKLISASATLGYDEELAEFNRTHIVFLQDHSVIDGIIESITGNLRGSITGDNDNDSITVETNADRNSQINTFNGNDVVSVGNDMTSNAVINSGAGNDTVTVGQDVKSSASINTEEGDDVIEVNRWLRGNASIDAGAGNDTITVVEIRYKTQTDAGPGDDTLTVDSVLSNFRGSVDMGEGDDVITINDSTNPLRGVTGNFDGGAGNDILNLPYVDTALWNTISHLFTGFETIVLSDQTITN